MAAPPPPPAFKKTAPKNWINYVQQNFAASPLTQRITKEILAINSSVTIFETLNDELEEEFNELTLNGESVKNIFKNVDYSRLNELLEVQPVSEEQKVAKAELALGRRRHHLDQVISAFFFTMKKQITFKKLGLSPLQLSYPVNVTGLTLNLAASEVIKVMKAIANCCVEKGLSAEEVYTYLNEIVQIRYNPPSVEALKGNPILLALPIDFSVRADPQVSTASSASATTTSSSEEEGALTTVKASSEAVTIKLDEKEIDSILYTPSQIARLVEMLITHAHFLEMNYDAEEAVKSKSFTQERIMQEDPPGSLIMQIWSSSLLTHLVNEILRAAHVLGTVHFYQEAQFQKILQQTAELSTNKSLAILVKTIQVHVYRLLKGLHMDASLIKPELHSLSSNTLLSLLDLRSNVDVDLSLGHYLAYVLKTREPEMLKQLASLQFYDEEQLHNATWCLRALHKQQKTWTSDADSNRVQEYDRKMKEHFAKAIHLADATNKQLEEVRTYFLCGKQFADIARLVNTIVASANNETLMRRVADALKQVEEVKSEEITLTSKRFIAGLSFTKGLQTVYASELPPIAQDIREYYALFVKKYPKKVQKQVETTTVESTTTPKAPPAEATISELPTSLPIYDALVLPKLYDVDSLMKTLVSFDASSFKYIVDYPQYIEFLTLAGQVLPNELVILILQHFGLQELIAFSKASKATFYFAHHPQLVRGSKLRSITRIPLPQFEALMNNYPVLENCGPLLQHKLYAIIKKLVLPATNESNQYILRQMESSKQPEHQQIFKLVTTLQDSNFLGAAKIFQRVVDSSISCKQSILYYDITIRCLELLLESKALKGVIKLLMILAASKRKISSNFGIDLEDLGKLVRTTVATKSPKKQLFLNCIKEIYWEKMCKGVSCQQEHKLIKLCLQELEKSEIVHSSLAKLVSNSAFISINKGTYTHHNIPSKLQQRVRDLFRFWQEKDKLYKEGAERRDKLASKFIRSVSVSGLKNFLQKLRAIFTVMDPPRAEQEDDDEVAPLDESEDDDVDLVL